MGKVLNGGIGPAEEDFISKQKVFFVGTAPLSQKGHVNISPKAPGTSVVVLDPYTIAYADLSGSGAETAAHVLENQRMTLLFCNLESGPPKLLRIHGIAKVLVKEQIDNDHDATLLLSKFPKEIISSFGFRAIYIVKANRVSSSCGYSMPVMTFERYRQTLNEFTQAKGADGMNEYILQKNSFSIDGLSSIGIVRHQLSNGAGSKKNDTTIIIPEPTDGYIYGKIVPGDDVQAENPQKNNAVLPMGYQGNNHQQQFTTTTTSTTTTTTTWSWKSFAIGIIMGGLIGAFVMHLTLEMQVLETKMSEIDL